VILYKEFVKTAKKYPDKIAIIDKMSNKEMTFAKTLIASLILSSKLKNIKEDFIGIMLPSSLGSILSVIATSFAGKIPVMINFSTGAEENILYSQKKLGFSTVLTSKKLLEKINCNEIEGMIFIEDILLKIHLKDKIKAAAIANMPVYIINKYFMPKADPDDVAVMLFTSGSEKDPKAVMLTHKNIYTNIRLLLETFNISEEEIMLANLPQFHVFGFTVQLWLPLIKGLKNITYPNPLDYKTICKIIREEKITIMIGTPAFFSGYLRASKEGDFKSIKYAITGADKLPEQLRKDFLIKHNIEIYEGYGTTETSPVVSVNFPGNNKPGSIGLPLKEVQIKIVHPETNEELPIGEIGKILVKGDIVMKGYFNDLEETSLRLKNGWYDTGDMGMLDEDGYLWHKGRLKRFVKIAGEMVSLVKIENVLEKFLPEGCECCVVELPDYTKGAKIIAAVTQEVKAKKIIKEMSKQLPPIYLPKQFVVLEELPKRGTGKIDFRKITELVQEKLQKNK